MLGVWAAWVRCLLQPSEPPARPPSRKQRKAPRCHHQPCGRPACPRPPGAAEPALELPGAEAVAGRPTKEGDRAVTLLH